MKKITFVSTCLVFILLFTLVCSFCVKPSFSQEIKITIQLPSPRYKGDTSLEETIFKRKSVRAYKDEALKLIDISQLLWAAAGRTIDAVSGPTRSYPSAGGIYPLEIYLVAGKVEGLLSGIYLYNWKEHSLTFTKEGDFRKELCSAALNQRMVQEAPVSIVFTATSEKTLRRYGQRGRRYVFMDAGGAGQNLHLQAEAMGLGTVIIGAFSDEEVEEILGSRDQTPLYIMPVGKPR